MKTMKKALYAACSAVTYAYLMNALGYPCEPRVAGKLTIRA